MPKVEFEIAEDVMEEFNFISEKINEDLGGDDPFDPNLFVQETIRQFNKNQKFALSFREYRNANS